MDRLIRNLKLNDEAFQNLYKVAKATGRTPLSLLTYLCERIQVIDDQLIVRQGGGPDLSHTRADSDYPHGTPDEAL